MSARGAFTSLVRPPVISLKHQLKIPSVSFVFNIFSGSLNKIRFEPRDLLNRSVASLQTQRWPYNAGFEQLSMYHQEIAYFTTCLRSAMKIDSALFRLSYQFSGKKERTRFERVYSIMQYTEFPSALFKVCLASLLQMRKRHFRKIRNVSDKIAVPQQFKMLNP